MPVWEREQGREKVKKREKGLTLIPLLIEKYDF
jgi:hypothetical protein